MRRRDFIGLVGGAAAWPLAARAQQATPAVGFLSGVSATDRSHLADAFRHGLNEVGYADGRNVRIEYRFAEGRADQLRLMAEDLVARKVAVIAAVGGNNTVLAARTLTSTIPIVFTSGFDPVRAGLVASLNRPGANVTGVSWFSGELGHKHVELLQDLLPPAALIALLINPNNNESGIYEQAAQEGARALGQRLLVVKARTTLEIDEAFATLARQRANALIIGADPFLPTRARQLAVLAARHAVAMMGNNRDFPVAGGLISYGNSITDAYRRAGLCVGRILNGAKPADMPIDRATKFELVINLGTARALGLTVPPTLLARADEVIE